MSRSIDERIVRMEFDNKRFEKGVSQTMKSLKNLKEASEFKGSSKGFAALEAAANKVRFNKLTENIEKIASRFSGLGGAIRRELDNLETRAVQAGERFLKSVTIDQVTAGWQKYEDKTSAVQTIMAATAKDFNDTGEQMEYVNDQLNKLNWFTDETSYHFLDMVSEIGKFTSKGIDLETSVTAMQGIANWAAISGANANSASHAMYNLSQALGTGAVKLLDWRSIENVNMDTVEFKNIVMETAAALGTLEKEANGTFKTIGKNVQEVDEASFASTLAEGWFTSDVLIKALDKYGSFTDKLYEITDKTGTTATEFLSYIEDYQNGTIDLSRISKKLAIDSSELSGYLEELSSDTYDVGRRAFIAGQEAKTLSEAIGSVKDAVSTGWMNTFELIFGDYNDARKLWTNVANGLWDIFASGGEARNELLSAWRKYQVGTTTTFKEAWTYANGYAELTEEAITNIDTIDGRDILFEGLANAAESLLNVFSAVKHAFTTVFPPMTVDRLMELTVKFRDLTETVKDWFRFDEDLLDSEEGVAEGLEAMSKPIQFIVKGFQSLFSIGSVVVDVFKDVTSAIFSGLKSSPRIWFQLVDIFDSLFNKIIAFKESFKDSKVYQDFIQSIASVTSTLVFYAGKAMIRLKQFGSFLSSKIAESPAWAKITKAFSGLSTKIANLLPKALENLGSFFGWILDSIESSTLVETILEKLGDSFTWLSEKAQSAWGWIVKLFSNIKSYIEGNADIQEWLSMIGEKLGGLGGVVKSFISIAIDSVKKIISGEGLGNLESNGLLANILKPFYLILDWAKSGFKDFESKWNQIKPYFSNVSESIKTGFNSILLKLKGLLFKFRDFAERVNLSEIIQKIFGGFEQIARLRFLWKFASFGDGLNKGLGKIGKGFKEIGQGIRGLSLKKQKVEGLGETILKIAKAIAILAGSVALLSYIYSWNPEGLEKSIKLIEGLAVGLLGFSTILAVIDKVTNKGVSTLGKSLLNLSIGVAVLAGSLVALSFVSWDRIIDGGEKLLLVLGSLLGFSYLYGKTGGVKGNFIQFGATILILVLAMKSLSKMNDETILKGAGLLYSTMLVLAGCFALMSSSGFKGFDKKSSPKFISFAVAVGILAYCMKQLSKLSWEEIIRGGSVLGGITAALVSILLAMSSVSKNSKNNFSAIAPMITALIALVGSIAAFVFAMRALDGLDGNDIWNKAKSFGLIMGGMVALVVAVAAVTNKLKLGYSDILKGGVTVFISSLAGGLSALISTITLQLIPVLGEWIGGSDWASTIETAAGVFKTTMDAMGGFLAASALEVLIFGILGKLTGGGVSIGFFGAVSSFITTLSSDLSAISNTMTTNLIPVVGRWISGEDWASDIDSGSKAFKTTMDAIGGFLTDNAKTTLLLGLAGSAGVKVSFFGAISQLILHIASGLSALVDTAFVELIGAMDALFASDSEDEGGISSNIKRAAEVLKTVRDALDDFQSAPDEVENGEDNATWLGSSLNRLIGSVSTLISDLVTDLDIFAQGAILELIGSNETLVNNINTGAEVVKTIGTAIGGFAGSIAGAYEGKKLETKSQSLVTFGENISDFQSKLSVFDQASVDSAAYVVATFSKLEEELNPEGGVWQFFTGEKDIGTFGTKLGEFGRGLKEFADSLPDDISGEDGKISKIVSAARSIIDLAKDAESFSGWGFEDLSWTLADIASTGFTSFASVFSDEEGNMKIAGLGLVELLCEGIEEGFVNLTNDGLLAIGSFIEGITQSSSSVVASGESISGILETNVENSSSMYSIGRDAVSGYVSGLQSRLSQVRSIASQIGNVTKSALRNSIDSHSPSRDAYKIASDFVSGYNNSLRDSLPYVSRSSEKLGEESIISLEDALSSLRSLIDYGVDSNPVITPIFDMSNLRDASALVDQSFSGRKTIGFALSEGIADNARAVSDSQIKMRTNFSNDDVVMAINNLTDRVDILSDSMSSMRIVMDTGATVGALAPAMDKTLGQRAVYKGRGN